MRRDWEAGLSVTFVTNSFEGCVQKAIYLHKGISYVCGTNTKAQFNYLIVFRTNQDWSKCVNYVQNRYNSQQICNGYEYPSVTCVRYKEFQISLDEGMQGQN